jgi:hypothetical protein
MAFQQDTNTGALFYIDFLTNLFFAVDIILMFYTAYVDEDSLETEDRKLVIVYIIIITPF